MRTVHGLQTKAIALAGLALFGLVTVLLFLVPPASGYEISIYRAYPWYFWVFVVGSILLGQATVLHSAITGDENDRSWVFGLALLMLTNAVLIFQPYIRGYPVYGRADVLTHIGYVWNITTDGVIGASNIYPNVHVLVQSLAFATGLEPRVLLNLIPPVFSLIYFGSMFFLVTELFSDRRQILFGAAFVTLPVSAHLNAVPFSVSILLAPFVVYLFVKEQRTNAVAVRSALVLAVVAHVIYHPLTTVFMLIAFGLYHAGKRIPRIQRDGLGPTHVFSLMFVVFTTWYYNFNGMIRRFESVFGVLLATESGTSTLESYSETVSRTSPNLLDLLEIAVFRYGLAALFVGLGGIFLVVAFVLWRRDEYEPDFFTGLFSAVFVLFSAGSISFFVNDFIVGFGRPLVFARIFNVVIVGALFYLLWRHVGGEVTTVDPNLVTAGTLLLIISLLVFGMFPSPISTQTNHQVTEMELDGSKWLFENRNEQFDTEEFGIAQYRVYETHYGTYGTQQNIRKQGTLPPEHFNYTEHQRYGASYEQDTYLILTRLGRITYQEKFPDYREHWRYTPADFDRLERDTSVARVYANGEFDAYFVHGRNGTAT